MDAYDIDSYWWPDAADFHEFEDMWPDLAHVAPIDESVFAHLPVRVDDEELSRLVADANLTEPEWGHNPTT